MEQTTNFAAARNDSRMAYRHVGRGWHMGRYLSGDRNNMPDAIWVSPTDQLGNSVVRVANLYNELSRYWFAMDQANNYPIHIIDVALATTTAIPRLNQRHVAFGWYIGYYTDTDGIAIIRYFAGLLADRDLHRRFMQLWWLSDEREFDHGNRDPARMRNTARWTENMNLDATAAYDATHPTPGFVIESDPGSREDFLRDQAAFGNEHYLHHPEVEVAAAPENVTTNPPAERHFEREHAPVQQGIAELQQLLQQIERIQLRIQDQLSEQVLQIHGMQEVQQQTQRQFQERMQEQMRHELGRMQQQIEQHRDEQQAEQRFQEQMQEQMWQGLWHIQQQQQQNRDQYQHHGQHQQQQGFLQPNQVGNFQPAQFEAQQGFVHPNNDLMMEQGMHFQPGQFGIFQREEANIFQPEHFDAQQGFMHPNIDEIMDRNLHYQPYLIHPPAVPDPRHEYFMQPEFMPPPGQAPHFHPLFRFIDERDNFQPRNNAGQWQYLWDEFNPWFERVIYEQLRNLAVYGPWPPENRPWDNLVRQMLVAGAGYEDDFLNEGEPLEWDTEGLYGVPVEETEQAPTQSEGTASLFSSDSGYVSDLVWEDELWALGEENAPEEAEAEEEANAETEANQGPWNTDVNGTLLSGNRWDGWGIEIWGGSEDGNQEDIDWLEAACGGGAAAGGGSSDVETEEKDDGDKGGSEETEEVEDEESDAGEDVQEEEEDESEEDDNDEESDSQDGDDDSGEGDDGPEDGDEYGAQGGTANDSQHDVNQQNTRGGDIDYESGDGSVAGHESEFGAVVASGDQDQDGDDAHESGNEGEGDQDSDGITISNNSTEIISVNTNDVANGNPAVNSTSAEVPIAASSSPAVASDATTLVNEDVLHPQALEVAVRSLFASIEARFGQPVFGDQQVEQSVEVEDLENDPAFQRFLAGEQDLLPRPEDTMPVVGNQQPVEEEEDLENDPAFQRFLAGEQDLLPRAEDHPRSRDAQTRDAPAAGNGDISPIADNNEQLHTRSMARSTRSESSESSNPDHRLQFHLEMSPARSSGITRHPRSLHSPTFFGRTGEIDPPDSNIFDPPANDRVQTPREVVALTHPDLLHFPPLPPSPTTTFHATRAARSSQGYAHPVNTSHQVSPRQALPHAHPVSAAVETHSSQRSSRRSSRQNQYGYPQPTNTFGSRLAGLDVYQYNRLAVDSGLLTSRFSSTTGSSPSIASQAPVAASAPASVARGPLVHPSSEPSRAVDGPDYFPGQLNEQFEQTPIDNRVPRIGRPASAPVPVFPVNEWIQNSVRPSSRGLRRVPKSHNLLG